MSQVLIKIFVCYSVALAVLWCPQVSAQKSASLTTEQQLKNCEVMASWVEQMARARDRGEPLSELVKAFPTDTVWRSEMLELAKLVYAGRVITPTEAKEGVLDKCYAAVK